MMVRTMSAPPTPLGGGAAPSLALFGGGGAGLDGGGGGASADDGVGSSVYGGGGASTLGGGGGGGSASVYSTERSGYFGGAALPSGSADGFGDADGAPAASRSERVAFYADDYTKVWDRDAPHTDRLPSPRRVTRSADDDTQGRLPRVHVAPRPLLVLPAGARRARWFRHARPAVFYHARPVHDATITHTVGAAGGVHTNSHGVA